MLTFCQIQDLSPPLYFRFHSPCFLYLSCYTYDFSCSNFSELLLPDFSPLFSMTCLREILSWQRHIPVSIFLSTDKRPPKVHILTFQHFSHLPATKYKSSGSCFQTTGEKKKQILDLQYVCSSQSVFYRTNSVYQMLFLELNLSYKVVTGQIP